MSANAVFLMLIRALNLIHLVKIWHSPTFVAVYDYMHICSPANFGNILTKRWSALFSESARHILHRTPYEALAPYVLLFYEYSLYFRWKTDSRQCHAHAEYAHRRCSQTILANMRLKSIDSITHLQGQKTAKSTTYFANEVELVLDKFWLKKIKKKL